MDKKVVRKKSGKVATKKVPAKVLNPTVPISKETKKLVVNKPEKISKEMVECRHCYKDFEKGLTICPYCHKSIKDQTGTVIIGILSVILLLSIIGNHFVNLYFTNPISENEYKINCRLTSYEELVRQPKEFKYQDIKILGKVVDVQGNDVSYGNIMTVTIDANLFNEDHEQIITFKYVDKEYATGFIKGDIVTVYGKYQSINGNIPHIDARYITFSS
ncbi:MAG: hypothetical protein GX265_04035 [Mollicutes bacterium]|nr:hypothetical protein [Mollicutes bacterium]